MKHLQWAHKQTLEVRAFMCGARGPAPAVINPVSVGLHSTKIILPTPIKQGCMRLPQAQGPQAR
jgi:hypothetical protein